MRLSQLQAFVVAAHEKSFTRAAEKLYIAQPTLTFRIQELEKTLGYPLFDRTGRSIELSESGYQLLQDVEKALQILDNGLKKASRPKPSAQRLSLACVAGFGYYYLPALFNFIMTSGLPLDVNLKTRHRSDEVLSLLNDGSAQVGILNVNIVSLPRKFKTLTLLKDSSCFVRHSNYSLAGNSPLQLRDLQEIPMIAYDREHVFGKTMEEFFTTNNIKPNIVVEVDSFEIVKQLLVQGVGISILPRIAVKRELAAGNLIEVKTELPLIEERRTCAVYPRRKTLPDAVYMFLEALEAYLDIY